MPHFNFRLSTAFESLLKEQAAKIDLGPSAYARQLVEASLLAPPTHAPNEPSPLAFESKALLERLAGRVCFLEELLLTLVSSKLGGGDKEERKNKIEAYLERANARAEKKAVKLIAEPDRQTSTSTQAEPSPARSPTGRPFRPSEARRASSVNRERALDVDGAHSASRPPAAQQAAGSHAAGGARGVAPAPVERGPRPSLIARVTGKDRT